MSLNQQTNSISGVINFPNGVYDKKYETLLEGFLTANCSEWFYILHDSDMDDNGELKTIHLHFLGKIISSDRKRLSTHLNDISNFMEISPLLISIDCWRYYENAIQYLIHKNNPEKQPYLPSDIVSNLSKETIDMILSRELDVTISFDFIYKCVLESKQLTEVYRRIGLKASKQYRNIIFDMFKENIK